MKKFAKMSLVAAIAVAGMTSANAKDLSEAIKNVDVSGTVVYRYDDKAFDDKSGATNNNYKIGLTLKSKVNDDITATTRFIVGSDANGFAGLDTNETGDQNVGVSLSQVNFTYTGVKNTSVIIGKQGIGTPWTNAIDSDGNEATGTGILAISTFGPVTGVAGYFNQTNLDDATRLKAKKDLTNAALDTDDEVNAANANTGSLDIMTAGLIANFAGINAEAWYLDAEDTFDSVYLGANYKMDLGSVKLGLDAKYTTMDMDNETPTTDDLGNWELGLTAKMGMFNAGVAYAETDEDGSAILMNVAKNGQIGYTTDISGTDDAEMWMFDLGAQVTPKLHVGLNYDKIEDNDADNADDHEETFVQVTYKMSKNFMGYVRLADGEDGTEDYNRGRLQVQYSF